MKNNILFYVAILLSVISIAFCLLTFLKKPKYPITQSDANALNAFNELFLKNITIDNDLNQIIYKLPTANLAIGPTFSGDYNDDVDYIFKLNSTNPDSDASANDTWNILELGNSSISGNKLVFTSEGKLDFQET